MQRHPFPSTCLSNKPHDGRVSDVVLHYSGCIGAHDRAKFFDSLPPEAQRRIIRNNDRIERLRGELETTREGTVAGAQLHEFKQAMSQWCTVNGRPNDRYALHPNSKTAGPRAHSRLSSLADLDDRIDTDIMASVMYFKNSEPHVEPSVQKVTVEELLSDNAGSNPIMQSCPDNVVRYIHLPANNMGWVEEAVARYYHEKRPDFDDLFLKSKMRRGRTRTETLLRPEFWHGQQNFDHRSEVHARHMRPFCDTIPTNLRATESVSKNMVLFMPYLHWETDRGRARTAKAIKDIGKKNLTIEEAVDQAQKQSNSHLNGGSTGGDENPGLSGRVEKVSPKQILFRVLFTAACVYEAMDFNTEERLLSKYLHARSPLHPRRTLDQSYYGALKNTGTRDRDQVVYRGTTPDQHDCDGMADCRQCNEDIRKVSRVIMVDQLWLWILDEKTVISCFPRRWGKNSPDPSAVHKTLRARLKYTRAGEVTSAYDLALIIVDECSRVFFDRTMTNDRQPNLVELFADAIRGVTYKQTAAFDQFLIYSHLVSREYRLARSADAATQNTLLNINPEGNLLKEVKDIMDELNIITGIKEQQQVVMESFVKYIRQALLPKIRGHRPIGSSRAAASWDLAVNATTKLSINEHEPTWTNEDREREQAKWTLARADHLLSSIQERIAELNTLLANARHTSAALKDLLTLKQQQAGVIEAREAATQAAETLKQGQSIMLFTVVTIVFLPLSFFATLFGMNSVELNDGNFTLSQEFVYMFPISAAIILTSFVLAFSRSFFTNSVAMYVRNAASFAYNTATTWFLVRTGLYVAAREVGAAASRLRVREMAVTGSLKAEEMRRRANLEKTRAADAMKQFAGGGGGAMAAAPIGPSRAMTGSDRWDMDTAVGGEGGRSTPFSPYSFGRAPSPGPGSPFFNGPQMRAAGKVPVVRADYFDVELGERKPSSQLGLVPRRQDR